MNNLMEENNELKRKYSQVMSESKLFKDYVEQKYISKQESTRRMSTLISKLDIYENEIGKLQNKINEIKIEKNNEIIQNEDEKENILDNQSYLSENSSIKQGINLEDLLENENEEEEENDNKIEKKSIHNKSPKSIKKHNNLEKKSIYSKSPKSIKKHKNLDIEKKSNLFILCPMNKMEDKKKKLNNIKIYKSPSSHISRSSYASKNMTAKKKRNAKSVKSIKIIKDKDNDKKEIIPDNNKIFFYLLLK
jgi:hypothetical protein